MEPMPWIRLALVVPLALALSSCGTLLSQAAGRSGCGNTPATRPNVYSGFVLDVQEGLRYRCPATGECTFFAPGPTANVELFLLLDIPLSLALDTVLLPYTAYQQAKHGNICTKGVPWPPPDHYERPAAATGTDGSPTVTAERRNRTDAPGATR
jgi:uncharacterized protein YceK